MKAWLRFEMLAMAGLAALPLHAQAAGVVLELHGKCFVRRASNPSAKPEVIRARGETIFVEDLVRCGPGGGLTLRLGSSDPEAGLTKSLGPSTEEYAVPLVPSQPPDPEQKLISKAIRDYGTRGGRERSAGGVLFSPPADGAVIPEEFKVRWNSWQGSERVTLTVLAEPNAQSYRTPAIPINAGEFTSEEMRSFVKEHGTSAPLRIAIYGEGDNAPRDIATFTALSAADEVSLQTELARSEHEPAPLMRHILRAYLFREKKLWLQAAEEYEAAVSEIQDSPDLLERAIRAENETGNLVRQAKFELQLKTLQQQQR